MAHWPHNRFPDRPFTLNRRRAPLARGLIGWWPAYAPASRGAGVLRDLSGGGRDVAGVPGWDRAAIAVPGAGSGLRVGGFAWPAQYSLAAWVRPDAVWQVDRSSALFSDGDGKRVLYWDFTIPAVCGRFYVYGNGASVAAATPAIAQPPTDRPSLIVATFDGRTARTYLDGVPAGEASFAEGVVPDPDTTDTLWFCQDVAARFVEGAAWARALSNADVRRLALAPTRYELCEVIDA